MTHNVRLGDALIQNGYITETQLQEALKMQKGSGKKIGTILIEENIITERILYEVLEKQYGVAYIDLNNFFIDPKVPKLINEGIAKKHKCIPVALDKGVLTLAMEDPLDMIAIDDIRIITGLRIKPVMSNHKDITNSITAYYDASEIAEKAVKEFNSNIDHYEEEVEEEDEDVTNAPMVRLVNSIIVQAVKSKASDIHIEPFEKNVRIRYRVDGDLREVMSPSKSTHSAIVTRIKIMGKMDISERRIPQDGRIETVVNNVPIDMRISILPTVYGEKVVIRLLDRTSLVKNKEELGFTAVNLKRVNEILKVPEGMVIVTGPTGSGKTTTLYSMLKEVNDDSKNIITIEDPVEYRLEGINQVQVNNKAGLTFASGLKSVLRQDPDIVMVGEIRDAETAQISVRAAITGHRVLSTLHTNDATSTISRLIDMGIEDYLVSSAVVGIIAQRLVKKVCPMCKEEIDATLVEKKTLKFSEETPLKVYKGKGCNACNHTGYMGRVAIHEVLMINKEIRNMINHQASNEEIQEMAQKMGMKTLQETARELVIKGDTTVEELIRLTYSFEN